MFERFKIKINFGDRPITENTVDKLEDFDNIFKTLKKKFR